MNKAATDEWARSIASKKPHTSPLRSKIINLIIKFDKI